jgi:hypothetical protein
MTLEKAMTISSEMTSLVPRLREYRSMCRRFAPRDARAGYYKRTGWPMTAIIYFGEMLAASLPAIVLIAIS